MTINLLLLLKDVFRPNNRAVSISTNVVISVSQVTERVTDRPKITLRSVDNEIHSESERVTRIEP